MTTLAKPEPGDVALATVEVVWSQDLSEEFGWRVPPEHHPFKLAEGSPGVRSIVMQPRSKNAATRMALETPPDREDLDALIARSKVLVDAMTPEEREEMWQAQKESWGRAEMRFEPLCPPKPRRASAFHRIGKTLLLALLFLVTFWLAFEVGAGVVRMMSEIEAMTTAAEEKARW